MKRAMFCGLSVALMAGVAFASDRSSLRSSVPAAVLGQPVLLGQPTEILLPPTLSPVPDPLYSPSVQQTSNQYSTPYAGSVTTAPGTISPGYPVVSQPIPLFSDVRYHAVRNISPCAVPTIIQVSDPCNTNCCKTCVNVEVCVPPCDPKCVKVTRDGNKVRYDYGKYAVVAKTVGNHVVVHYYD